MLIKTRKILASIGLLIAIAVGPLYVFGQSTYTLVTSESDLVAGEAYIIVGKKSDAYKAMGYQKDNNRHAVTVDVNESNKTISITCATEASDGNSVFEFILGGTTDNWTFYDNTSNSYLYAANSSANQLKSQSTIDDNAKWSISVAETGLCTITANGDNTRNDMRYYETSSSSLFSCYASTSTNSKVSLYKKSVGPTIDETPPTFTTTQIENITKNSFDLKVITDEPCTVFYQVVAEGETAPINDDLLTSGATILVEAKNTEYTATISELEPETIYNVYLIAKDTAENVQNDITTISAQTLSAIQKTITLGEIEAKYYWGETATIRWTTNNIDAATDLDSILIFKGGNKIESHPIDITAGEADILIGNTTPTPETYATNYSLKVVSGNVESETSANYTIVPTITIRQLVIDTTNNGESSFKGSIVRAKGLVTGYKSSNFTIQDGIGDFCATFVTNPNTTVAIGDSVYAEGIVGTTTNMIKIGSSSTTFVTRINSNNELPTPQIVSIPEIIANKGLTNVIVTIENVIYKNKIFYNGSDSIAYANTLFTNTNNYLKEDRKYNITGAVGIDSKKKKQIWPRSQMPEDFYLYSNNTTLAELIIGGHDALNTDTVVFTDLNINGIAATANDAKATLSIRVNNNIVASSEWGNYSFSPLDSVFVTVTAEDGTEKTYKRIIDCKTLNFNAFANNTFGTGETINLSWTSHNIAQISLILEFQNDTVSLTESSINADLNEWQYTIPNSMFGEGWIKALSNGTELDGIEVTIADTRAPTVIRQNPANGSSDVKNSLYVSMAFDEPVLIAEGAKLIVNNLEFPIIQIGDSAAKSFINGLSYSTLYNISLSINAICDLAGNAAVINNWSFTTMEAPQPDLYFSEYAKGSGSNKYYEIYNPCDTMVDLSRYFVTMDKFNSSGRSQASLQLSGWLIPNEVLVVVNSGASAEIKRMADVSTTKTTDFTGDDLLGLFRKNGDENVLIDVLGPFGNCDVAANWAVAGTANASADKTIVRNVIICGTTDWAESAGTDPFDSQWTVLGENVWTSLGRHGIGHNAEILRMSIGSIAATIDGAEATVSVEVPYGTDLTKLAVSRRISQGAQIFINDLLAKDTIDFSLPVTATVIAGDSVNQKEWTIIVTMAPKPSSEKNILTFKFAETTPVSVTIDTAQAIINAEVAFNIDSLKLTPVITISDKAKVSTSLFRTSKGIYTAKTRWDFDEPQTIEVTAQDLTVKNWTVNVEKEPEPQLSFSPLTNNSFETGDVINLSWTSLNIEQISLTLKIQGTEIQLTDSTISADLGMWQYTVPNSLFGSGLVKAVRNGIAIDSIAVSIADTKAPTAIRKSPSNGAVNVNNSLYVKIVFDEAISVSDGAKMKVGDREFPITIEGDTAAKAFVSGLDYGKTFEITLPDGAIRDLAGNNAVIGNWTFTTRNTPQPDLYFSEYSKGSSNNKYYEIYNPCDTAVDLSRYFVMMDKFSTNRSQASLQLSGWLMPHEVLIVANSGASAEIKQMADVSTTKTTDFTGDDLLGLFRKNGDDTVLIDVLGPFGNCDVAANWVVAGDKDASSKKTIVRDVIICGTTDWAESAGADSLDSQWTVLKQDDLTSLGRHGIGHNAEILRMSIGGIAATIDGTEATVSVEVPYGTDLTKLAVSHRISQGAQIFINDSLAKDTIDFSLPVTATVIAGDSVNMKEWTITVTMAPKPSSENNILTFSFVETTPVSVTIDTTNAIINTVVAFNLDSLKLTPVITLSDKAKVSSTLFRTSKGIFTAKTRWDFDEPQTITVAAEDLTEKNWTVNVEKEPEPLFSFSPLTTNSFGTGEKISLAWTCINVSRISLAIDIQDNTIQLTDSAINADLGEWNFVVPDGLLGNGLVKAIRNGIALDSIAVNITDAKAPMVVRQNPSNGGKGIANSLYVSIVFNEPVSVAEGTKLKVGNIEAAVAVVNDTIVRAFVSGLDFGKEYSVELPTDAIKDFAGNAAVINKWTFSTRNAPQPELYFSEYAKGSSNNKYYEIYNPCDTAVELSLYFVTMDNFTSSSRSQATLQLSGWLMPNEVLVVANSSASAEIKQMADVSTTKTTSFTGDDLLGLFRKNGDDTVLIDVLGPFGNCETAANWAVAGIENASTNKTIIRNVIICGTTDWAESAGIDSLDSQWTVLGKDDWSDIGQHGIGHNADILKMSIGGIEANIYPAAMGVLVEVPYGTDLTRLAVSYRISQGAQMFINGSLAADTIDFSQPVTATVIAGDSVNQKVWTIIVTMAPKPSSDNSVLTFNFVETTPISVTIDTANATIDAIVAYNLDSLKLTPIITIAEFASVSSTLFKLSKGIFTAKTRWDFNEPQTIKVTAEDLTEKVWNVRVDWEKTKELTIKEIYQLTGGLMANVGKPISTEGVVTHIVITSKGTEIYIQDSAGMWSGIMVFDEGNLYAATVAVGDRIRVSGVIAENFGMANISQLESLEILSSGNQILADTIIVEDALSTAYHNSIVTIDSVICIGGFESLFTVCDSTNSILVYNKYRISDFALEIDSMYRITGIVYYTSADNSYRLIPRSADDIVKLARPVKSTPEQQKPNEPKPQESDTTTVGIIGLTDIGLTAYTMGRTIVIENAEAPVSVFDVAGKLIATARLAQRITIDAPHSGIYIVGTRQGAIKVMVK